MKALRYILAALLLTTLFHSVALAQNVQNFNIDSFTADYYLNRDSENASKLSVKETIIAEFPNFDQNHGILRAIPKTYQGHTLSLKVLSVQNETNKSYQYSSYTQNDNLVLKIGNPDTFVRGKTTYVISYEMMDVISFYDSHDEFFWDINGDQWQQQFGNVAARIHIPDEVANNLQSRQLCYTGVRTSTSQNCEINRNDNGQEAVVTSSANNLGPGQTLSVVLGFNSGTFQKSSAVKKEERNEKIALISSILVIVSIPLGVTLFMQRRWRQFGNDPKGRGVIIPEYEPPKGFDVLSSDFLLKQQLSNKAFSAALIDLAVRGFVAIYEIPKKGMFGKKDYELELTSSPSDISQDLRTVLSIVFDSNLTVGTRIKLSEIAKSSSKRTEVYNSMKGLEKSLANDLHTRGFFIKNPKSVKNGYQVWSSIIFALGIGGFFLAGWTNQYIGVFAPISFAFAVALIFSAVLVFLYSFIMPARTETGVAANDHLLGLKDYIKLAEADRLKYLQSPEGAEKIADKDEFAPKTDAQKVKLFEKLLPYAILFGLEKDWAKQFEGIYVHPPDWYHGDYSTFSAIYLADSLNGFSAATGSSFAPPSSSSGSGFSGGGAGGGGGGGGGGGW